jgi:hypothetical protein
MLAVYAGKIDSDRVSVRAIYMVALTLPEGWQCWR